VSEKTLEIFLCTFVSCQGQLKITKSQNLDFIAFYKISQQLWKWGCSKSINSRESLYRKVFSKIATSIPAQTPPRFADVGGVTLLFDQIQVSILYNHQTWLVLGLTKKSFRTLGYQTTVKQ